MPSRPPPGICRRTGRRRGVAAGRPRHYAMGDDTAAGHRPPEGRVAEQLVGRLEFGPGMDRDERTAAIRTERERLEREHPGGRLRERVLAGAGGRNVVEWYREDA